MHLIVALGLFWLTEYIKALVFVAFASTMAPPKQGSKAYKKYLEQQKNRKSKERVVQQLHHARERARPFVRAERLRCMRLVSEEVQTSSCILRI